MVGVIHAGWRGMAEGVIERTLSEIGVENMRMMAWLGPAIGPNHFEVGDEVRQAFMKDDAKAASAFFPILAMMRNGLRIFLYWRGSDWPRPGLIRSTAADSVRSATQAGFFLIGVTAQPAGWRR